MNGFWNANEILLSYIFGAIIWSYNTTLVRRRM